MEIPEGCEYEHLAVLIDSMLESVERRQPVAWVGAEMRAYLAEPIGDHPTLTWGVELIGPCPNDDNSERNWRVTKHDLQLELRQWAQGWIDPWAAIRLADPSTPLRVSDKSPLHRQMRQLHDQRRTKDARGETVSINAPIAFVGPHGCVQLAGAARWVCTFDEPYPGRLRRTITRGTVVPHVGRMIDEAIGWVEPWWACQFAVGPSFAVGPEQLPLLPERDRVREYVAAREGLISAITAVLGRTMTSPWLGRTWPGTPRRGVYLLGESRTA